METILIATDFSKSANHAARYAAHLSVQLNAKRLILYHSYELLPTSADIPESIALSDGRLHERSLDLLKELKQELVDGIDAETMILTIANSSNLDQGINDLAVEHGVSMVVIGLSGKHTWEKLLVGSSTKKLIGTCHISLLIVPVTSTFTEIYKIVMGCDLEDVSSTLPAEKISHFVGKLNAQLLVVHVDHREEEHFDADMIRQQYAFYDLLGDLDVSIRYIDNKSIDKGILTYTEENQAQMIIVVAKKHSMLERITKESISRKLAAKTAVPLLIIH